MSDLQAPLRENVKLLGQLLGNTIRRDLGDAVPLDRPMRSVQQRFTRQFNARHRVFGPLWQGRYRAKLVADERYLGQLFAFIHLNPVTAGMVIDPSQYEWSGHAKSSAGTADPFQILARDSAGRLVKMGIDKGRAAKLKLKVGICGEPSSGVGVSVQSQTDRTLADLPEQTIDYTSCPAPQRYLQREVYGYLESVDRTLPANMS